jgi:hypothetical protein
MWIKPRLTPSRSTLSRSFLRILVVFERPVLAIDTMILDFFDKMTELTIDGKKPWCDGANAMHWDGQYTQFSILAKEDDFSDNI